MIEFSSKDSKTKSVTRIGYTLQVYYQNTLNEHKIDFWKICWISNETTSRISGKLLWKNWMHMSDSQQFQLN